MDAIGETIENVGLAQEIQKGLANNLQKPPKWAEFQGDIDAAKAKLCSMSGWAFYNESLLTKGAMKMWASTYEYDLSQGRRRSSVSGMAQKPLPTQGGVDANWADFKEHEASTPGSTRAVHPFRVLTAPFFGRRWTWWQSTWRLARSSRRRR